MTTPVNRLDASESLFVARQLESIDRTAYETVYPDLRGREFVPTQQNVPDWAMVYTWTMLDQYGKAKLAGRNATDMPKVNAAKRESSRSIYPVTASFDYTLMELKAAAANNLPLDATKAQAAKRAIETEIDRVIMLGDSAYGLEGLLTLTSTTSLTLADSGGIPGSKTWANKTPDEIAADIADAVSAIRVAMKASGGPVFQRFSVLVPDAQYVRIATRRMGDGSNTTILDFLRSFPFVASIDSSHHCVSAGSGNTDRMVVYPRDPMVLAGIVPLEFTRLQPEQHGLLYEVPCLATTGGVVCRYPVAVAYGDGI